MSAKKPKSSNLAIQELEKRIKYYEIRQKDFIEQVSTKEALIQQYHEAIEVLHEKINEEHEILQHLTKAVQDLNELENLKF